MTVPSNRDIAELLVAESERVSEDQRRRALRRAGRAALFWREEAAELLDEGRPLTVLDRVGPWIASEIERLAVTVATPPPLRAGFLSWTEASAAAAALRDKVRGDLQSHTLWSDGHSTVDEMLTAASAFGHEFLLITDHSKGLSIANGLDEERLERQWVEFADADARSEVRLLRGLEMDIDIGGAGDMKADALSRLDVILGAFHSALRRKEDQTERYLAALRNPWVDILAHPRCRMYNGRIGLSAYWPRVFAEAARLDKAVEIDGYPARQDLDVELVRIAGGSGVRISLGSDAHHVIDIEYITFAIGAAALAGIPPERIVNCMAPDDVVAWAAQHRR